MCGVVGGFSSNLIEMLCRIQHRGFTSCGFVSRHTECQYADRVHMLHKVREPGVGHVRYATQKSPRQPFKYKDAWLVFNGEVADGDTLKLAKSLYEGGVVDGAFSFIWMRGGTILAGRDARGFHPLFYAWSEMGYVAASETVADHMLHWNEVPAGSVVDLKSGRVFPEYKVFPTQPKPCCFEDVYFSHVASHGVWERRYELGKHIQIPKFTDAIVPVPDSSIAAAEAASERTGIPVISAIVKNRYAERTFIAESGFDAKYTIIRDAIRGKRIVLVDDSIVRGHTMRELVPRLKCLAREVHVRVTFPTIKHACRYGVRIEGEGCHDIKGADSVEFLDESLFSGCKACVDGIYWSEPSPVPQLPGFQV